MRTFVYTIVLVVGILLLADCRKDKALADIGGYPNDIGKIMVYKCATSGCHNGASYLASAGLNLTTWETMFAGSNAGSSVIPFRSDFSSLCYFVNTFPEFGAINVPTMPYNKSALSKGEVKAIKDWIDAGAPNLGGFVKWSDNPNRKKIYVTNQGCDVVTVFDAETNLPMRYITVGRNSSSIEVPHMVKVSPDGLYWYVIFTGSSYLQKYRCSDDAFVGEVNLNNYLDWNTFVISENSKRAYCVSYIPLSNGKIISVDLEKMTTINPFGGEYNVHGIALNATNDTLYLAAQTGNYIIKMDTSLAYTQTLTLQNGFPPTAASSLDPHEIMLSPDKQSLYITCQKSNEVRVFSIASQSVTNIIATGNFPQEMAVSEAKNKLYVTCMYDLTSFPGYEGSVSEIDLSTYAEQRIQVGFMPHGIAVDESKNLIYVASRNLLTTGPAPHHSAACSGRNGFISFINLGTFALKPKRTEISVDPYSVAIRK